MFRVALKGILARKARLLLTSLAVIVGTAFLSGTLIFSDTLRQSFDELFTDVYENTDAYVRSTNVVETDFGNEERQRLPDDIVADVAAVPGVATAQGNVTGFARVIGSDGDPIGSDGDGPPTFGASLEMGPISPWVFVEGAAPSGPSEVVLDKRSADDGDYRIGDSVRVVSQGGSREFTLTGVVRFGEVDSPGGATFALFDLPTAQDFVGIPGYVDAVLVTGDGSLDDDALADAIQAALPAEFEAETLTGAEITDETTSDIEEALSFITIFLTVFSGIALGVACFVIYNVFSITGAQRQRENALLRAIGASRRQVTRAMLIESVVVGLIGSLLGLAFGALVSQGLRSMLNAFGVDLPSTSLQLLTRTIVVTLVVGLIVTVLSAVLPALRAGRVPPLAAMRDTALDTAGSTRARLIGGLVPLALGIALITAVAAGARAMLVLFAVLLVFAGVIVLGPLLAKPAANTLGAPLARWRGVPGQMARGNAGRNPKRTAGTAAPVLIGVALVTAATLLAATFKAQIREIFGEQFTGDYVVQTNSFGFGGLSPDLADRLNEMPEVGTAAGIGLRSGSVDGKGRQLTVVNPQTVADLFDLEVDQGDISQLTVDGVFVSESRADDDDLRVGSTIVVDFPDLGERTLTVQGVYSRDELAGNYTVSRALFEGSSSNYYDFSVFITKAPDVDSSDAEAAISAVVDEYGTGEFKTRTQYIDDQAAQVNTLVGMIYGLLGLSILIAAFGIIITLLLSVYERRREIGLLRAVGMTRRQVRATVRWESVITSMLGALLGVLLGLFVGYALVLALRDQGITVFTVPVAGTITILVIAFLVGVAAAVYPAWRATRTNVLEAITTT